MSTQATTAAGLLKSLVYVDMARRRRMLKREAWAFIILAHVSLGLAWIFPGTFDTSSGAIVLWTWAMMLLRVAYFHVGLILLLIGTIAAVMRNWRMALCCLPLVFITVLRPSLNFHPSPSTTRGPVLKVISANLLMINRDAEPILTEIESANADVVFLQEYTRHWDDAFLQRLGKTYPYRIVYPQEDSFGAAIYSRYPFAGEPRRDATMGRWSVVQLGATIDFNGTNVDCRNIHLIPPRTFDYTKEHFDEMRDFQETLAAEKDKLVIVAGDFNFTGSTMQAGAIKSAGFHDAFNQSGGGRGATWPVNGIFRYLPGIRLDHIFLSPRLKCRSIQTGTGQGSDHRPLLAEIELPAP